MHAFSNPRNSFANNTKKRIFFQSENILLAMVNDENMIVCKLGLRRVLRSKNLCKGSGMSPPLLHDFTNDEIDKAIIEGNPLLYGSKLLNISCHTQAVERKIKLVTKASSKVCGQTSRDGYIRAALPSRKVISAFNTKNQFQV